MKNFLSYTFGFATGVVLSSVIIFSTRYEEQDIPRLCNEYGISLEDVNYLSKQVNCSRYTTLLVLKRGVDNGSDIETIIEYLDPRLTIENKKTIISNLKEEY